MKKELIVLIELMDQLDEHIYNLLNDGIEDAALERELWNLHDAITSVGDEL